MKALSFVRALRIFSGSLLMIAVFMTPIVTYAESVLDEKPFKHVSLDQHLKEVIEYFVSAYSLNASFSEAFLSEAYPLINGQFDVEKGSEFLDKVAALYNLSWYFDGRILHITVGADQDKQLHRLSKDESDYIQETLKQMDAYSGNFSWKYLENLEMLEIYGQSEFLDSFVSTYSLVSEQFRKNNISPRGSNTNRWKEHVAPALPTDFVIRSFKLRYASAEDTYHTFRGRESVSQGVVSRLRELFNLAEVGAGKGQYQSGFTPSQQKANSRQPLASALNDTSKMNDLLNSPNQPFVNVGGRNMPMPPLGLNPNLTASAGGQGEANSGDRLIPTINPTSGKPKPYISYDSITNNIIIYDERQKMALYEKAISAMDSIARQIQIEVTVVEVAVEKLSELGVNWSVIGSDGTLSLNPAATSNTPGGGSFAQSIIQSGEKTNVLTGQVQSIIGSVRALSETGDGQVISQPAVMTVDNTPALIDNTRTFFVRLSGERTADLFDVEVGSTLAVKPRIINSSTPRQIRLEVRIEDGAIEDFSVDDIPVIKENTIETRSVIEENTSLIVGGYFFDSISSTNTGVPLLRNIPFVKRLFSSEQKIRRKMMKMFIITPTIIDHNYDEKVIAKEIREHVNENKKFSTVDIIKPASRIFD